MRFALVLVNVMACLVVLALGPAYSATKNLCGMDNPLACYGYYAFGSLVVLGVIFSLDMAVPRWGLPRVIAAKILIAASVPIATAML